MSEFPVYPVPESWRRSAYVGRARYEEMYRRSVTDPDHFWAEQAREFLHWDKPWDSVCGGDFGAGTATSWRNGRSGAMSIVFSKTRRPRETSTAVAFG